MKQHSCRCCPDAEEGWKYSLCQELNERVKEFQSLLFLGGQDFIEEISGKFLELLGHPSVGSLVEDLKDFKVSNFPSLLEMTRIYFEQLYEFKQLRFGGILNFIDFLKNCQYFRDDSW